MRFCSICAGKNATGCKVIAEVKCLPAIPGAPEAHSQLLVDLCPDHLREVMGAVGAFAPELNGTLVGILKNKRESCVATDSTKNETTKGWVAPFTYHPSTPEIRQYIEDGAGEHERSFTVVIDRIIRIEMEKVGAETGRPAIT